jgi:hypothetical protein
MSAVIYRALDVESIVKIIETEGIQAIKGRPTCHSLIVLLNELGNGARNVKCEYSQFGMLWCVHPPNIYQILTGETVTVTAPPIPGLFPAYDENVSSTQNTLIQIQWQKQKELADMKENTIWHSSKLQKAN